MIIPTLDLVGKAVYHVYWYETTREVLSSSSEPCATCGRGDFARKYISQPHLYITTHEEVVKGVSKDGLFTEETYDGSNYLEEYRDLDCWFESLKEAEAYQMKIQKAYDEGDLP